MEVTVAGELSFVIDIPTNMSRLVPEVAWEMMMLDPVVVPVEVLSTAMAASAAVAKMTAKKPAIRPSIVFLT